MSARDPNFKFINRSVNNRLKMKHLELFKQVCEQLTLRKAADASNMTQPAATKLIQELEDIFSVPLFHRDRRGMKVTRYGEVVYRHMAVLMSDIANLQVELELVANGGAGRVRLGTVPTISSDLLTLSITRMHKAQPGVQVSVREGTTTGLIEALMRGELDLTFGRVLNEISSRHLGHVKVYDEPFSIVSRVGHTLLSSGRVNWQALSRARWVLPESGTPTRDLVNAAFSKHSVLRPVAAVECSAQEKVRDLVAHSDLLGVLPTSSALGAGKDKRLAVLKASLGANLAPISLIFREDVDQPPVVMAFTDIIRSTAQELKLDQTAI